MSESPAVSQRSGPWWRWITIGLLVVLLLFLAVWNLLPPNVARNPVMLDRGADGKLQEQPGKGGNSLHFNAHAGVLKSQNSTTTASSESHSNPAFLADRSLMIFNFSKHVLMERIGTELLEHLKSDTHFDRVAYYPLGHLPEAGTEAPDLVLSLDLGSIEESGIAGRTLKATVTATLGSSLAASNHSVSDHLSPPIVTQNASISVEHQSSLSGIESSSAQYRQQGQDIAKQFVTAISGKLTPLREKHTPLPKLPALLRPDFVAAPEFQFLKRLQATRQTSFHGFMIHNETFWKFTSTENVEPMLTSLRDELSQSDWRVGAFEAAQGQNAHLRAVKGDAILELFTAERRIFRVPEAKEPQGPTTFYVRYLHRMGSDELQAALAKLLSAENPDVEILMTLRRFGSPEQQFQTIEWIEKRPPRSVEAWVMLAEAYAGKKDVDACRRALVRASLLLRTVTKPGDCEQRIKQLAKQQMIDEADLKAVDPADLADLGIVELIAGAAPSEVEVPANSAACFFVADEANGPTVLTVRVQTDAHRRSDSPATVTYLTASENSRSWSTQTLPRGISKYDFVLAEGKAIHATSEKLDNGLFRVSASWAK